MNKSPCCGVQHNLRKTHDYVDKNVNQKGNFRKFSKRGCTAENSLAEDLPEDEFTEGSREDSTGDTSHSSDVATSDQDEYEEDSFLVQDNTDVSSYDPSEESDEDYQDDDDNEIICLDKEDSEKESDDYNDKRDTRSIAETDKRERPGEISYLRRSKRKRVMKKQSIAHDEDDTSNDYSPMIDDPSSENSQEHPFGSSGNDSSKSSINTNNEEENLPSSKHRRVRTAIEQVRGQLTIGQTVPFHVTKTTEK
ncbi:hypothetical protein HJC23_004098 [Cyclotella cryptica]|uniref:Uncharacterized protein n=1 Tax=Cyclotella cryptica TaxID=29204 RepID=A0ABD3P2C5_9STRA